MTSQTQPSFPKRVWDALLDIIFPRECLITGEPELADGFSYLSQNGKACLRFLGENVCPHCGAPFPGQMVVRGECVHCRDRKFRFGRSRSAVVYDDAARSLVLAIKYHAFHAAAEDLAKLASQNEPFRRHLEGAVLVPVPLFSKREHLRGYNQSLVLAKALTKYIPGTCVFDCLVRLRDTGTQTRLSALSRRVNVRKAFAVDKKFDDKINAAARYVVIDDVFTTGSTLNECARSLKKSGARNVDAATFAHG